MVEDASGRRLAVECDGDKYHGPERWADDMRRQPILERVGWRFWRCWASSFVLDPDDCMADLFATLDRFGIETDASARAATFYSAHVRAARKAESERASDKAEGSLNGATSSAAILLNPVGHDAIRLHDRVVVQYLDDRKLLTFTLTKDRDDLTNGFLPATSPLGERLLGASEDEEIEFEIGGRMRRVLILKVDRQVSA